MWPDLWQNLGLVNIQSCLFVARFVGISGEFFQTIFVFNFVRRSRAEITMARPKEPDMSPKRTKEVRLVIYQTQIWPSDNDVLSISGH